MSEHIRQNRAARDVKIWQPIIDAWRNLADDEEGVILSDITPTGFSGASLATDAADHRAMCWVWHKV